MLDVDALSLNKWTPGTILVVAGGILVMGVTGFYAYHMMPPPDWVSSILIAVTGGGLFGAGHAVGTNSAQAVAKQVTDANLAAVNGGQNASGGAPNSIHS